MNLKSVENRTISLAALFQSCLMVRDIAKNGKEINQSVETCIHSLFQIDSGSVIDIYGGTKGLTNGFKVLAKQLSQSDKQAREIELIRYVFALIYLERRLIKQTELMNTLSTGVKNARGQADYFSSETHSNVIANLADLYQKTVSTLNPKIMVHGEPEILSNPDNANIIRALLLSGMRAAILWRQCGGSRWQLLFGRRKIVDSCATLLEKSIRENELDQS